MVIAVTVSHRSALREPTYFVLAALIDAPLHGYGIVKQVEGLSEQRLRLTAGTLYGVLERLVEQGLIAPEREDGRRAACAATTA